MTARRSTLTTPISTYLSQVEKQWAGMATLGAKLDQLLYWDYEQARGYPSRYL